MRKVSDKGMFDFKDDEIRPGTYDVELANAPGFHVEKLLAKGAKTAGQTIEIGGGGKRATGLHRHSRPGANQWSRAARR